MSPDRWRMIDELFDGAVALAPDSRRSYLERKCAGDASLREQVERLLENDSRASQFLRDATLPMPFAQTFEQTPGPSPGGRIGAYRLVRQIGSGGMGAVWLAERADDQFHSRVAVKFLHAGIDRGDVLHRFRQERQLLANLRHPNISRLLDGGATDDGRPYLVMEYVEGLPIDRYCDERQRSLTKRLELFRVVCSAVQYAHQNLVVHRDLKPGNILVSENGTPTLLDFGIAKVIDPAVATPSPAITLTGERYLTPAYASPEQLKGEPITTAADVYSLGVILYELLTGQKPYRLSGASLAEFERAVCDQLPDLPSLRIATQPTESRRLRGDLDKIVLMALRKEPQRRYVSVEQFSEDLRRHLVGLPVIARPDTIRYRSVKFVKRNRLPVARVASIFILLSALTLITWIQSRRVALQRTLAEQRYEQTQRVAEFQAAMLNQLNAEAMGSTVVAELRKQAEAGLARQKLAQSQIDAALRQFDEALRPANAVDASRRIVDASLLKPALEAIPVQFQGQPEVAAKLRRTIGGVYLGLGLFDAAEQQLREALSVQRRLPAADRGELAATLEMLGQALRLKHDYATAEPALREALAIRRAVYGPRHPNVAQTLNDLGLLMIDKGDTASAEPLLDEALDIYLDSPGHPDEVANTLQLIAGMRFTRKDLAGAEDYFRQALKMERNLHGEKDRRVAICLSDVAAVLDARGEYGAAAPLLEEAIHIWIKTRGEEHPETLTAKLNLAGVYTEAKRYADAELLLLDVVRAQTSAGTDPGNALHRLVKLYRDWNKLDAAARCEARLAQLQPPAK